jgi:NhaP-type Na+/H+ or K+/H+ antiporter
VEARVAASAPPHHPQHQQQQRQGRLTALILGENVINEALSLLLFRTAFEDYQQGPRKELDHVTGACVWAFVLWVMVGCMYVYARGK